MSTITGYYKSAYLSSSVPIDLLTCLVYWTNGSLRFSVEDDWNTSKCPANNPLNSHMLLLFRNPTILSSLVRLKAQTISFARMHWARSDLSKYQNHWREWRDWSLCVVSSSFLRKAGPNADTISKITLKATMLSSDFFRLSQRRILNWLERLFTFWKKAMWKSGKGLASGEAFFLENIVKSDRYVALVDRPLSFGADGLTPQPTDGNQEVMGLSEGEEANESDDRRQNEWPTMSMSRTNGMSVIPMPGHIPHVFGILTSASLLLPQNVDVCQLITITENSRNHHICPLIISPLLFTRRDPSRNFRFWDSSKIHGNSRYIETFSWLEVLYDGVLATLNGPHGWFTFLNWIVRRVLFTTIFTYSALFTTMFDCPVRSSWMSTSKF